MTQERRAYEGLARHMTVRYEPARLERHWAAVSQRALPLRPPWWRAARPWALAGAMGIGAFFVGRAVTPPLSAPAASAATQVSCEGGGQAVSVPGVGSIECASGSAYRVDWTAQRIVVDLDRGAVTLDIPPGTGRSWAVLAGSVEVRVVGTRFSVRREGGGAQVSVERGRVEVVSGAAPDAVRALVAGESWSSSLPPPSAPTAAASSVSSAAPGPPSAGSGSVEPPPVASGSAAVEPPRAPTWEELAKAKKPREAWDVLGADGFARAVDSASAEKLFRLAEVARASGHIKEAAKAFDVLRRKHRGDPRAGIAAFELGRIRQDSFRDPGGAADALSDAIALAPGAPFREDAQARLVDALHASGGGAGCVSARDAYLARWPSGAHAATVRTRCKR